jgi:hypothetical protein
LEECIQHFWVYRGVIYKKETVTDDLFARSGFNDSETLIMNALDHISMNPNILCPVSYYKVVCHVADRKNDEIRNKAYETILICKSVMGICVTVECIQLLRRMLIDANRANVKKNVVTILCEICRINPNLITFDIYDMLRSYKIPISEMSLSHAIQITLQEIRQHCVHLHTQIDEYETSLLTTYYNNYNNIESEWEYKNNEISRNQSETNKNNNSVHNDCIIISNNMLSDSSDEDSNSDIDIDSWDQQDTVDNLIRDFIGNKQI